MLRRALSTKWGQSGKVDVAPSEKAGTVVDPLALPGPSEVQDPSKPPPKNEAVTEQPSFADDLLSRLEILASLQGVDERADKLSGAPRLDLSELDKVDSKTKKKKKKKKKDKDKVAAEPCFPESMFSVPPATVSQDIFSPRYSPESASPGKAQGSSSGTDPSLLDFYLDPGEILRNLEIAQSGGQDRELSKQQLKEQMRARVREGIVARHLKKQGLLAFALPEVEQRGDVLFQKGRPAGKDKDKGQVRNESKKWTVRENTFDPWATGVFMEEDMWKIESPMEVQNILRALDGGGQRTRAKDKTPSLDGIDVPNEPPSAGILSIVDVDVDAAEEEKIDNNGNGEVSGDMAGEWGAESCAWSDRGDEFVPRSPRMAEAAYSPTFKPKYSPRGYLEFINKGFQAPAFEVGIIQVSSYEFPHQLPVDVDDDDGRPRPMAFPHNDAEQLRPQSPNSSTPVSMLVVPISQVWSQRPYPHHLVGLLEGRAWPHSRSAAEIWAVLEREIITELIQVTLCGDLWLLIESVCVAELAQETAEAEAEEERQRLSQRSLLGKMSFKQVGKSVAQLSRMFGGFGADGTKKVNPEPPLHTQSQLQQHLHNAEDLHDDEYEEVDDLAEQASIRRRRLLDFGSDD